MQREIYVHQKLHDEICIHDLRIDEDNDNPYVYHCSPKIHMGETVVQIYYLCNVLYTDNNTNQRLEASNNCDPF